jgi:hypothetical protein
VYLEVVVVLASVMAQVLATASAAVAASGVPLRTLRRWGYWWRDVFPRLRMWAELRARFVPPPPDGAGLPQSLIARLMDERHRQDEVGDVLADAEALLASARHLAPATTNSVVEGSRFVTAAWAQMGAR